MCIALVKLLQFYYTSARANPRFRNIINIQNHVITSLNRLRRSRGRESTPFARLQRWPTLVNFF